MKFNITVNLDCADNDNNPIFTKENLSYSGNSKKMKNGEYSKPKYDELRIYKNRIVISGDRTSNTLQTPEKITHSTIYDHIISSLIYYSFSMKKTITVKNVEINNNILKQEQINQLFPNPIIFSSFVKKDELEFVFDKKSRLKKVYLYFLQGISENNEKLKFERLWMAFNCLYSYELNFDTDAKKQKNIKTIIGTDKNSKFIRSTSRAEEILNSHISSFRWNKYITNALKQIDLKNKNPKLSNKELYEKFIEEIQVYEDPKIERHFIEVLKKRKYIEDKSKVDVKELDSFKNYVKKNEKNKKRILYDSIKLLCIDYAYFLRCTFFHGAVNDSYYVLFKVDCIDEELKLINELLVLLIQELINTGKMNSDVKKKIILR